MISFKNGLRKNKPVQSQSAIRRRDFIKSLAGIPVLGFFIHQYLIKTEYEENKRASLLKELNIQQPEAKTAPQTVSTGKKELIRIGIIGFGSRGETLARALGFAYPDWVENQQRSSNGNGSASRLREWLGQENLYVAITGICDVFDERRERGLQAAMNRTGPIATDVALPDTIVYTDYRKMLEDKNIDAVIISTPDFWHAQMTIDAVNAGKHVYCEKCMTRLESEVYRVERAVKKSNVVFQLGHQYHQNAAFDQARQVIGNNVLGKITLIEATSNRNTPSGAWIRHLDSSGNPKPGSTNNIDWSKWLGSRPSVPFSIDRYYNWTKWWDYATGLSGQLMSHEYDRANQLLNLGIPSSCVASGGIYFHKDNRQIPDVFHAVFEFDDKDLTFMYSASLASSRTRGQVFMGHDASMEIGNDINLKIDYNSTRFKKQIETGKINSTNNNFTFQPGMEGIDAITSATEKYYAERGLMSTFRNGKRVDTNHLHLKEWLDCIRDGGEVSVPIDKGVEVTIACHMATRAYREKRRVRWDSRRKKIV